MPWYKTGTATVTLSSATVTGAGTAWVDNTRIGDAFIGPDGLVYEITARASDTSLTIAPPYKSATGSARPYVIAPMQGYVKTLADQAQLLINSTEPIVPAGTTAQFYRGDKTWQAMASLPVSTAQQTALNAKANLASPAFAGTPTAPTAAAGVNSTQLATTAYALAAAALRYGKNNVLGTVSQSAGVPTGAVIERGSNANGSYVRFADGTQICWLPSFNDTATAFVVYATVQAYPATFVGAVAVTGTINGLGSTEAFMATLSANAVTTTSAHLLRRYDIPQVYSGSFTVSGRWY